MGGKIASDVLPIGHCHACNKDWHRTRRSAKKFMRATGIAHDGHMNVYRCPAENRYLHTGHLPPAVLEGRLTRGEVYRPHEIRRALTQEDRMTASTIAPTAETPQAPANYYSQGASAALADMLADLTTYRYVIGVPVTPALARLLIDLNSDNNRNHKPTVSDAYCRDMENGKWVEETGQTLKIATNGRLVDGLHRVHAVLKSLKTVKFDLCFGLEPESAVVVDQNAARSIADIIRIAGGADISRSQAIVRRICAWERGLPMGFRSGDKATPVEVYERYLLTPQLFDAAARRGGDCNNHNVGTPLVSGTAFYLFCQHDDDAAVAHEFFDSLISGLGFDDTNTAIRMLRERMIRRRNDRLSATEMLALYIRAWNRYNTIKDGAREVVQRLQIAREELTNSTFPIPVRAHAFNRQAARYRAAE